MKRAPLEELEVWLQRIVETVNSAQDELEEEDTLALEDTLCSAAECAEEALWLCRKQIDARIRDASASPGSAIALRN